MKKRVKTILCCIIAIVLIVSQTGCGGKEPVSGSDFLLNTSCSITIYRSSQNQEAKAELIQQAFALSRDYENQLSRTVASGDVGRINSAAGQPIAVQDATAEVVRAGLYYGSLSGGLFDITVGVLSDLWNFSGDAPSVPDADAVAKAVRDVGYENVLVSGGELETVQLTKQGAKLDLGGIAKGYIADKAADFLRENGVESAILNFGGNIVCIGEKEKEEPFVIGVEKPFSAEGGAEKEILGTIRVKDQAVVTSGTYERKFYQDGKLYFHILDPETGYPRETDLDGVSIVGPNSTDCDGLSTTCLMLGLEKGRALIDSLPDYEAVFITKDGAVTVTTGLVLEQVK